MRKSLLIIEAFLMMMWSVAYGQFNSLQDLPFTTYRFGFDADSAKFTSGGVLANYSDGTEMTLGWWDVTQKTSAPNLNQFGLQPDGSTITTNEGFWYSNRLNNHAVVSFITVPSVSARGFTGVDNGGIEWWDFLHKGEFTQILIYNTVVNPATETEFVMHSSVNSTQRGIRIQTPAGSTADRFQLVVTNGSGNSLVFSHDGVAQDSWHIVVMRWEYNITGFDFYLWVDSITKTDSVESSAVPSTADPTLALQFAGGTTESQAADSLQVAVWAGTDSSMTDADVIDMITWASCRYGITVAGVNCSVPSIKLGITNRRGKRRSSR